MAELITSEHNPLLKEVRRAVSKGALTADGYALAEGFHLLEEAVGAGVEIGAVIAAEAAAATVESLLHRSHVRIVAVPEKVFAGLSTTESPKGVLTLIRLKSWTLDDLKGSRPLILILDGIQDPGNAGAVIRSAEAFGATGVVLLKETVHAHNPKCLRGSAGSIFRMPLVEKADAQTVLDFLQINGIGLYAAMPRSGKFSDQTNFGEACAFAVGSEGHGVGSLISSAATAIRIPTTGVESLNAAVAAAVLLYEVQRQRKPHEPV